MGTKGVIGELEVVLGKGGVKTDPDLLASVETDWTGRFTGSALALIAPTTTEEVQAAVEICAKHSTALVPHGGNTGLAGGATPRGGEVVLSTAKLNSVGTVDTASRQIEVGAGVTLSQLQHAAGQHGLIAGLDLGARDSATVGGLIACDAGGPRAIRHGTARQRVVGLEAVLGDGTVVRRMSGLVKDNAGYNLPALITGSEGTLGIITRAIWRLEVPPQSPVAALIGVDSPEEAVTILESLTTLGAPLEAADFFMRPGLELVTEHLGLDTPFAKSYEAFLLVEVEDRGDLMERLEPALETVDAEQILIGTDTHDRNRLWAFREGHTEAIGAAGVPHKMDVGVPLRELGSFAQAVATLTYQRPPGASVHLFGHLGDGNVHVNILGLSPDDQEVDLAVLQLVADHGGTISAEHGVGTAKAKYLNLIRSEPEIEAMRAIKRALDPHGILNPGAVLAVSPGDPD